MYPNVQVLYIAWLMFVCICYIFLTPYDWGAPWTFHTLELLCLATRAHVRGLGHVWWGWFHLMVIQFCPRIYIMNTCERLKDRRFTLVCQISTISTSIMFSHVLILVWCFLFFSLHFFPLRHQCRYISRREEALLNPTSTTLLASLISLIEYSKHWPSLRFLVSLHHV